MELKTQKKKPWGNIRPKATKEVLQVTKASKPKTIKTRITTLCPNCPFDFEVSSIETSIIDNHDRAFVFYLDIKNISKERITVEFPLTSYSNNKNFAVQQDYWLAGFPQGNLGIAIKPKTFKRAGLIYLQNQLKQISIGDTLLIEATTAPQNAKYIVTLGCVTNEPYKFIPITVQQDGPTQKEIISSNMLGWRNGEKREITSIIERLELLEEKFGIKLSGIYATLEKSDYDDSDYSIDYELLLNCDIFSANGASLDNSFCIKVVAYSETGQSLGADETDIDSEIFLGFDSLSFDMFVSQPPARIQLFPANTGY